MDLKEIKDPSFLQELSIKELEELSEEIRNFIIDAVSKRGGHLSSNLGIVELTIALHRYFHNGEKFIFDVGHQSYPGPENSYLNVSFGNSKNAPNFLVVQLGVLAQNQNFLQMFRQLFQSLPCLINRFFF